MPPHAAARPIRVALVVVLAVLATIGLAGPASAHAALIGSDPADGATLSTAPTVVTLTFDDSLEDFEPFVTVTGPDGNEYQSGPVTVDGATLTTSVAPLPGSGAYAIAYRVVSDDGHPVEGQIQFALAIPLPEPTVPPVSTPASSALPASSSPAPTGQAAATTATSSAEPATTSSPPAAESTTAWSSWAWLAVAVLLVIVSAASVLIRRRFAARSVDR